MDMAVRQATPLQVRPNAFFIGATEGVGVERDGFGRMRRRFRTQAEGRAIETYTAVSVTETYCFDDGQIDVWRWVISASPGGKFVAAEIGQQSGIVSETAGEDLWFRFRRGFTPTKALIPVAFTVRMTMLTPQTMLQATNVSVLGIPTRRLIHTIRRCGET